MTNYLIKLYPLLFALYPILFTYNNNIHLVTDRELLCGILFTFVVFVLFWPIGLLLKKSPQKRRFVHAVILSCFFLYGRIYHALQGHTLGSLFQIIYPLTSFIFLIVIIRLIDRAKVWNKHIEQIVIVMGISLNLINMTGILKYRLLAESKEFSISKHDPLPVFKGEFKPDIYHIILDEYACSYILQKVFNYDNKPFENTLKEKGFLLPKLSMAPAVWTKKSIASILNMEKITKKQSPSKWISNNKVQKTLEANGYHTIYIGNEYNAGKWKPTTGVYVNYFDTDLKRYIFSDFLLKVYAQTCFHKILTRSHSSLSYREKTEHSFTYVENIAAEKGRPKHIFFHVLCPHWPFIYGPNGEDIPASKAENWDEPSLYLGQLQYISKRVLKTIDMIIQRSPEPPIIILQSDHGPRFLKKGKIHYKPRYEIRFALNAWYLPEKYAMDLPKQTETVNTYQRLFNHLFKTDLPLLPKRNFRELPAVLLENRNLIDSQPKTK